MEQPKLILLRGNSGSGKSTVAEQLRQRASSKRVAIVGQDNLRRTILKEKESEGTVNLGLIHQTVQYTLSNDYDVILEGILYFPRYRAILTDLIATWPNHFVYYFDVSLAETIRRHHTKPNAHEFGEPQLKDWYRSRDLTNFDGEQIIPQIFTLDRTVAQILADTSL